MNERDEVPRNEAADPGEAADAAFQDNPRDDTGAESTEPGASAEAANEEAPMETRDEEIERLRRAAAEADKRVLIAQADLENFRKRLRRDSEEQIKYAALPLISDLLDVRDNLVRALDAAQQSGESGGLKDGVAMVAKQLDDTLNRYAIREIPAEGELFDPNYHEAISQMPSDHPAGTVAHVAKTGFQMHDRVIRPSQVIVSTGPAEK